MGLYHEIHVTILYPEAWKSGDDLALAEIEYLKQSALIYNFHFETTVDKLDPKDVLSLRQAYEHDLMDS